MRRRELDGKRLVASQRSGRGRHGDQSSTNDRIPK